MVLLPRCSGVHSARAVSPTAMPAKKLVLLSIVAVVAPLGRLAMVAVPPRLSASAMMAPPCRMPKRLPSSSRTTSSATTRSRDRWMTFRPRKSAKGGCVSASGRMGFLVLQMANSEWRVANRGVGSRYSLSLLAIRSNSVDHHAADRLALVHEIEALVDVRERHRVGDHRVDLDLLLHVPVDDLRHVGAAASAAEGRALPHPSGHQLERPRGDLGAGRRHADDDRLPPAAVTGFQRLAHHRDIAGAVERVVGAADLVGPALGHVDQVGHKLAADLLRIDEVGHAEALAPFLLARIEVDADDHVGAGQPQALDHVEADAAEPEHDAFRSRLDLGGVEHRADAGGDAAADVADLVERRVLADFRYRDLRQHGVIREGRAAHVVVDLLALDGKARRAVGHHALPLGGADGGAQVG